MTPYEAVLIHGDDDWPPLPPLRHGRDMAWYHLAVIAASVFAIGVVAWNLAVAS